jgi:hypothetical protein
MMERSWTGGHGGEHASTEHGAAEEVH